MKFCSQCGNPVTQRIPEGDSRLRFVCDSCQAIHYQNPNIVAGCVATWGSKVLLCRRAIEPRRGYWTLPAGFMENGETIEQAAICLLYTSPSPRDATLSRMPSSA